MFVSMFPDIFWGILCVSWVGLRVTVKGTDSGMGKFSLAIRGHERVYSTVYSALGSASENRELSGLLLVYIWQHDCDFVLGLLFYL